MLFSNLWRRYGGLALLFSLVLGSVLIFANVGNYSQPATATQALPNITEKNAPLQVSATLADRNRLSLTENVRKTLLENNLTVLTKEVHAAPVVTVQVWYKIGSRNEEPGLNGIAHQLEHMMFKGTTNRPIQFGRLFSALGSQSNAFTSYDQTAYFGTVERDKLTAMLVLEADRMENAPLEAEQLTSEKRVVISELQGYENSPSYRLDRAIMAAVLPNSPYGLTVGGTKADVEKFTVEQVRRYYQNYYSPNNAILIIVGDFQTEPTLKTVRELFGKIPNRQSSMARSQLPVATMDRQLTNNNNPIVLKEPGSAPTIEVVYRIPPNNHPDVAPLQVMDYILTSGRSSRIYQSLVETGLASDAGGYAANMIGAGWYELYATAAPNQKLTEIDRVLQQSIEDLQNKGVTPEELSRAKTQFRANTILRNREITAQAMQLGDDETSTGDYTYTDRLLEAVTKVTAADVQRVANEYLTESNRTVGYFEPTQLTAQAGNGSNNNTQTAEQFNIGPPVDPAEVAKYLPSFTTSDSANTSNQQNLPELFTLDNGLQILLLADRSTPTVTLGGYIQAGTEFDPDSKAGLAGMTANNLMNGTKTQDALTLAKNLEEKGASLSFGASREGVGISGYSIAEDLPVLIETMADVLQNGTFGTEQLELSRQRALTDLKEGLDNPGYLAYRTLQQTVYPKLHPFHIYPTVDSLKSISDRDVKLFYKEHYRPDTTVLALVGDFEPQKVRSLIATTLGNWKTTGKPPTLNFPTVPLPEKLVRINPVIPGKAQAITFMGYRGIARQDPRYYAAIVLNEIIGGDAFASRLGAEIRDRQGLTYGIYSYFQAGEQAGMFLINMQTSPEDASKAISSTVALLQEIQTQGVSSTEVENAKRSTLGNYTVELSDPDSLTDEILMNQVYDLPRSEIRDFARKIKAVTPNQVNQVAKELLHPNNLVVVTAGPPIAAASR